MRLPCLIPLAGLCGLLPAQTITQQWSYPGAFAGGVGYDSITNHVWVVDETNVMIREFTRTGTQLQQFPPPVVTGITLPLPIGVKVHPVSGNLWIVDEAEVVYEMTPQGAVLRSWSTLPAITDASAIAIDPVSNTIWVANDSGHFLAEYDMSGAPLTSFSTSGAGSLDSDGLAYNPLNRHFYLGEDTGDQVIEITRTGLLVQTFPLASFPISPEGMDLDTRTGSLFIGGGLAQLTIFEVSGIVPQGLGTVITYGTGCPDSGNTVPVLAASHSPTIGGPISIAIQGSASIQSFAWFSFGFTRSMIPLAGFGIPNCTLNNEGAQIVPPLGIAHGRGGFTLSYPAALGQQTVTFACLIMPDGNANVFGLSASNGIELTFR